MAGVTIRPLVVHRDGRGSVRETYRASWFPDVPPIVQLVRSKSLPGTLRGMHYHKLQWDVWTFVSGSALVRLDDDLIEADPGMTIAIPPGFGHGLYTRDGCVLLYGLTREYDGTDEYGYDAFDGLAGWPANTSNLRVSDRDLLALTR